ncbi:tRNA (guanine(9)-N(1))-methyltransferase [Aspergillus tanneri]|nr:tRNA (guanine(9)-N(1))-methyltransferase [Aspergillus tanneri]KAA8645979.1 tRNA (guanine(9)-N(1))-methyltransferase [Aspergillus tanneri]
MDGEERPRKLPRLGNDKDAQDESESVMTGAVGCTPDNDATPTTKGHESDADDRQKLPVNANESVPKMSKNQLKKLRRQEQWEAQRDLRKIRRKEKAQEKKDRIRKEWDEAKKEGPEAVERLRKERESTRHRFRNTTLLPLTLVMDCGFDELMNEKERISLSQQLARCYSDNSRTPYRSHLVISSFDKLLKERYETVMRKTHENWKGVRFLGEDFVYAAEQAREWMKGPEGGELAGIFADKMDVTPKDGEVVYLSSESPHTLTELKPYSTYIIGGLVDKNRHKGICYKRAVEKGIKTAKLPIGDYIQMTSRQVLATNHVVEIMLRWLELGDWGEAFMQVIPQRKGGTLKDSNCSSEEPVQHGDSADAGSEDVQEASQDALEDPGES